MDVQTLMEKKDSLTDNIKDEFDSISETFTSIVNTIYNLCSTSPSIISIALWITIFLYSGGMMIATISSCVVYITAIIGQYVKNRIKKEKLENIDLEYIGLTLTTDSVLKKRSVTDLIGEYVEDCFNRDVLFFKPLAIKDYIPENEKEEMLTTLLDSAASNLSPEVREKLSLYVGEDNLHKIIARKALSIVTAFVANRNKAIYTNKPMNSEK